MLSTRMAGLVRRHGWWFNAISVAWIGYFAARAAIAMVAHGLRVIPSVDDAFLAPPAPPPSSPQHHARFSAIAERNLLGLKHENLQPQQAEAAAEEHRVSGREFKESELQPCSVNAVVRATLVAEDPAASLAVILHPLTREPTIYTINDGSCDLAEDAVVVAVRNREVVIRRRNHFERCKGEGESASASPAISVVPEPPLLGGGEPADPSPNDMSGVTKVSETDYRVERAEVDRVLANLNEVAMQARIVPSFRNGKANGFKMFSIKPGSIYAKIGLQNGDVIQKINGFEMNGVDRALEVFAKLREATSLVVDILRRGEAKTLSYVIQ